jgi:hypothetical protein
MGTVIKKKNSVKKGFGKLLASNALKDFGHGFQGSFIFIPSYQLD